MIDRLESEVEMIARHLDVLKLVISHEPIGIVKMTNETGYPHHKIRYSLRVLQEENLIEPTDQGAITTDQTSEFIDSFDTQIEDTVERLEQMRITSSDGSNS